MALSLISFNVAGSVIDVRGEVLHSFGGAGNQMVYSIKSKRKGVKLMIILSMN